MSISNTSPTSSPRVIPELGGFSFGRGESPTPKKLPKKLDEASFPAEELPPRERAAPAVPSVSSSAVPIEPVLRSSLGERPMTTGGQAQAEGIDTPAQQRRLGGGGAEAFLCNPSLAGPLQVPCLSIGTIRLAKKPFDPVRKAANLMCASRISGGSSSCTIFPPTGRRGWTTTSTGSGPSGAGRTVTFSEQETTSPRERVVTMEQLEQTAKETIDNGLIAPPFSRRGARARLSSASGEGGPRQTLGQAVRYAKQQFGTSTTRSCGAVVREKRQDQHEDPQGVAAISTTTTGPTAFNIISEMRSSIARTGAPSSTTQDHADDIFEDDGAEDRIVDSSQFAARVEKHEQLCGRGPVDKHVIFYSVGTRNS